ncbi:hypothetical protein EPYR_01246 [Erwinia pyrifoliae DSM 12163]|nr:hypothetical protein EPYR_01246 [Erwinia pyrifoliae DSM 12163]
MVAIITVITIVGTRTGSGKADVSGQGLRTAR